MRLLLAFLIISTSIAAKEFTCVLPLTSDALTFDFVIGPSRPVQSNLGQLDQDRFYVEVVLNGRKKLWQDFIESGSHFIKGQGETFEEAITQTVDQCFEQGQTMKCFAEYSRKDKEERLHPNPLFLPDHLTYPGSYEELIQLEEDEQRDIFTNISEINLGMNCWYSPDMTKRPFNIRRDRYTLLEFVSAIDKTDFETASESEKTLYESLIAE